MFFLTLLTKNHSSFEQYCDFINDKMLCWIVQFTEFVVQNVKNLPYFPKPVILGIILVWRIIIVFKVEESENMKEVVTHQ
jgi:hypothetical protein